MKTETRKRFCVLQYLKQDRFTPFKSVIAKPHSPTPLKYPAFKIHFPCFKNKNSYEIVSILFLLYNHLSESAYIIFGHTFDLVLCLPGREMVPTVEAYF